MKAILVLLIILTLSDATDFCQQHRNTLYDLFDQIDDHIKGGRVVSVCNEIDRAKFFNKRLLVDCKDQNAKVTERHLWHMEQNYCKGVR